MKIKGKNIWITGASSGIGKALTIEISKLETNIIISSRNLSELLKIKKICEKNGSKCTIIPINLESETSVIESIKKTKEKISHIDILINNAGISQRAYASQTSTKIDRKIMEINFFSTVILTKSVLQQMIKQKSGHIIAISSISGLFGFPLRSAYAASKFAMAGFYETLYFELKPKNINVTTIYPGRIRTNISKNALKSNGTTHGKMDEGQKNGITAEKCAKKIIKAIEKNKKEALIGGKELIIAHIKRIFPRIFNKIINHIKPT